MLFISTVLDTVATVSSLFRFFLLPILGTIAILIIACCLYDFVSNKFSMKRRSNDAIQHTELTQVPSSDASQLDQLLSHWTNSICQVLGDNQTQEEQVWSPSMMSYSMIPRPVFQKNVRFLLKATWGANRGKLSNCILFDDDYKIILWKRKLSFLL